MQLIKGCYPILISHLCDIATHLFQDLSRHKPEFNFLSPQVMAFIIWVLFRFFWNQEVVFLSILRLSSVADTNFCFKHFVLQEFCQTCSKNKIK